MDNEEKEYFYEEFIQCLQEVNFNITDANRRIYNLTYRFIKEETNICSFLRVACKHNCIDKVVDLFDININDYDVLLSILYNDNIENKEGVIEQIEQIENVGYDFKNSDALIRFIEENENLKRMKKIGKCIPFLIKKGLDINYHEDCYTALNEAYSCGYHNIVKIMLDNGANPYIDCLVQKKNKKKSFAHILNKYTDDVSKILSISIDIVRHIMTFIYKK